jgi:hypothetical protein
VIVMAWTRASTRFLPAADPPNLVAHIRTWRACDVGAATVRVTMGQFGRSPRVRC